MATIQASSVIMFSLSSLCFSRGRGRVNATINAPKKINFNPLIALSKHQEYSSMSGGRRILFSENVASSDHDQDPEVAAKFYAVMEAVADRVEMHRNIGEQRNNWNNLLLNSINAMTLSAAVMTGMAAIAANGGTLLALKISSAVLYASATAMLVVMNVIEPSQLAEEQRNASRLFKQLHRELQTVVALGSSSPTVCDVNKATERVLDLDRAFPLPLLGYKMIEKFPNVVEPAVWWPNQRIMQLSKRKGKVSVNDNNGWNLKLEEEMENIVEVLKRKDMDDYMKLGNKMLAISVPVMTGIAAIGSAFVGTNNGSLAVMVGVMCGAIASVVNTFEHGGQVGMVFEMYRSNAGFFKLMQETIESNVNERDVERRENGQVFQTKVALQLGRSLSELRHLAASAAASSCSDEEEFASKLF
ncbi:hypothetical protein Ddye_019724 [Dipteronia dyeriana]|uniref:F-box protein n=1 Tax=Dipteronia dyeriana TaxID=168575 RepID=A0AAD9TYC2_9ROSI|nr:hypothetical protein Ddye_019724 [Dipteronia dyeriana]